MPESQRNTSDEPVCGNFIDRHGTVQHKSPRLLKAQSKWAHMLPGPKQDWNSRTIKKNRRCVNCKRFDS